MRSARIELRDDADRVFRSIMKSYAKTLAIGFFVGALIFLVFVLTGIDRWWLRLFGAVALTAAAIWTRFDSRRPKGVDTPPGLPPAAAVGFHLGAATTHFHSSAFLLLIAAYAWTKVLAVHLQWSAPLLAVASLATAMWYHARIDDDVENVPPFFVTNRQAYIEFVADVRRIERNTFLGMFGLFAFVGTMSWLLE